MDNKNKDLTKVSTGITVMFLVFWIYKFFIERNILSLKNSQIPVGTILLYTLGLGLFIYITKDIKKQNYKKGKLSFKTYLTCFFLQFTALVLVSLINILFVFVTKSNPSSVGELNFNILISLLIFAPIVEELVFRHLFAKRLLKYGETFYILVSSFCFCFLHGVSMGIPAIIYTFILGLIWSYLLVKTGNIMVTIVFHSLSNLFGVVLSQWLPSVSKLVFTVYIILIIVFAIIGLILFIVNKKEFNLGEKLYSKTNLKQVFTNKGIIFYIIITTIFIIIKQLLM